MRIARNVLIGGGLLALLLFGWNFFVQPQIHEQKISTDIQVSAALIEAHQPQKALELLKNHAADINMQTDAGKAWLHLLISAYADTEDSAALVFLYGRFPKAFNQNEYAAQLVAKALLKEHQFDNYENLRADWQGKEKDSTSWLFLDSEAQSIQGNYHEAANLLTSRSFTGKDETDRLVRLALLHIVEDPKLSWNYLAEASIKDPDNAELNSFKANLLSSIGKNKMALAEYIQAIKKDPHNLYLREQLADVYLHDGAYTSAMEVMEDAMFAPSTDAAWLKALFWSRMTHPLKNTWKGSDLPQGSLSPLVSYVFGLPKNVSWNSATFEKMPEMNRYLKTRQETYWLRLVEALKKGSESEAGTLLRQNPFYTVSWEPSLENALKAALVYRKLRLTDPENTLPIPQADWSKEIPSKGDSDTDIVMQLSKQQFQDTLQELYHAQEQHLNLPAVTQDIDHLLMSKEAFAAIFLAYNWEEAALQLHKLHIIAPSSPDWLVYYLTLAMQNNRDSKAALQFASPQKATPETSLLIANLALSLGLPKAAQTELSTIYKRDDKIGYSAALELTQLYLKQDNPPAAKEVVLNQPLLSTSIKGKEILARIAILEGNPEAATSIYSSIEEESTEAKSFLIRKAYTERNWAKAKQLTEDLIALHPDNSQLQENLQRIILEQRRNAL